MANEDKKFIPGYVPMKLIEGALNEGIIEVKSDVMMEYFEKIAGHRIYTPKPIDNSEFKSRDDAARLHHQKMKSSSHSPTLKPVGFQKKMPAFMEKGLSYNEMYDIATDDATKKRDASEVLKKKNYGISLAATYKEWMTPELFDYLSMSGPRAQGEFRAACYPARVAFSHRIQRVDGMMWATPYITIFTPLSAKDSKDDFSIKKGEGAYSFYLTKDRQIHAINDTAMRVDTIKNLDTRENQKAESMKAWQKSDCEKRVRLVNPKTKQEQYILLQSQGTEGWQEKNFFKMQDSYKWPEVYDVTSCMHDGVVDYDEYWGRVMNRDTIEMMGRSAIAKIPDIVMGTENLKGYRSNYVYDYDKKGELVQIEVPGGFEKFQHESADGFEKYWDQTFMSLELDRLSNERA